MRRRDVVAGVGALGALAGGLWLSRSGAGGDGLDPVTVETIDAPGSEAGAVTVPVPGSVTVLDLFATSCAPCRPQVGALADARAEVGDGVRFVSVTNQALGRTLTRADLREWWAAAGGDWTVGLDDEGRLTRALGARTLPFTAVLDRAGRVAWSHGGLSEADTVVSQVRAVDGGAGD